MAGKGSAQIPRNTRHGAWSKHVRKRYTDARTREGRQLRAVMDGLIADLGNHENLTAGQRLLLDTIQSKLIVILQISKYINRQPSIIDQSGQLLPVLGKSYLSYLNSLRLALAELYKMSNDRGKAPDLEEYIHQNYGEKK